MGFKYFASSLGLVFLFTFCAHGQSNLAVTPAKGMLPICNNYVLPIGNDDVDLPNIQAEFGASDALQFQKKLRQQLNAATIDNVFQNARFFLRSFENRSVGYLYDRVVLQADVTALSFLIRLTQSTEPQVRADALSAVAFIHFQMESAEDKAKGLEYIQTAMKGLNNYPAVVFWGRANVWGDGYSTKNLNIAMNFLAAAGQIPEERRQQNKRMDPLNTQEVHTQTLSHLIVNVPEMPNRSSYEPLYSQGMNIIRIQEDYKQQFAKSNDFSPIASTLQEFDTFLRSPELARSFDQVKTSALPQGWDRLNNIMSRQEQLAATVHGLVELSDSQKELVVKLEAQNQKLQTVLAQTQRKLIFQLMTSKEEFPQNVKASKSLSAVDSAVSRSCSLSSTWQNRV